MFDFSAYLLGLIDMFNSLMLTSPFNFVLYYAFSVLVVAFFVLLIKAIKRSNN